MQAAVNGVLGASIYAPNGNPQPGPKFDYKLAWLKRLNAHAAELYATGAPVVLAGDYNVVPTDLDIYPTKSWDRNALLQPESRTAYQPFYRKARALHPEEPMYTFWDYMQNRWERDSGLRLDHVLLSSVSTERLQDGGVDRHLRGMEGASDHAPVWVRLRGGPGRRGASIRKASGQTTALPKTQQSTHRTGDRTGRGSRAARIVQPAPLGRPLLVIDGDSFAHRSYTPCQKPFAAATVRARAPSSASQISCCGSTQTSGLAPLLSDGTAWMSRQAATKCFPPTKAGGSSMMN